MLRRVLILMIVGCPITLVAQERIDSARFPVEREAFIASNNQRFDSTGVVDSICTIFFSGAERRLQFEGLQRVALPPPGQQPNDRFYIVTDTFTLNTTIRTSDGEYAFQGTNNNWYGRTISGKIRIASQGIIRGLPRGTSSSFCWRSMAARFKAS